MRTYTTQAIGIRTPIIHENDNLENVVITSLSDYCNQTNTKLCNSDIIGITEALVARAQGNYATIEQIAKDIKQKFPSGKIGVVFPILSRNRFSILLKAIALAAKEVYVLLSYPMDEVGNHLVDEELLIQKGVNSYQDSFSEEEFRREFGDVSHKFTKIDYLELYRKLGNNAKIILSNNPCEILKYTSDVIVADIHKRVRTKAILKKNGATTVFGLDEILNKSVDGSGFNEKYGLLGSNKAGEDTVKLFPNNCSDFVSNIQMRVKETFGVLVEVLVYGDGAFKDPIGGIWELADPVVSPGYTSRLGGLPNELKLKYLADTELSQLHGEEARLAMIDKIKTKDHDLSGKDETEGTTPRRIVDLVGSLCDLVSGSGDKGTPVILIKGYFDNYSTE